MDSVDKNHKKRTNVFIILRGYITQSAYGTFFLVILICFNMVHLLFSGLLLISILGLKSIYISGFLFSCVPLYIACLLDFSTIGRVAVGHRQQSTGKDIVATISFS